MQVFVFEPIRPCFLEKAFGKSKNRRPLSLQSLVTAMSELLGEVLSPP